MFTQGYAFAAADSLAWMLFCEADYAAARREALREHASDPEREDLAFLAAASKLHVDPDDEAALATMKLLASKASLTPRMQALQAGRSCRDGGQVAYDCHGCMANGDKRIASRRGMAARLSFMIVHFYRSQISTAIGHRCVMHPSCSEYFRRAAHTHGWLGVPLLADRLVREPDVTKKAENPVWIGGMQRFADPLADHTFWMNPVRRSCRKDAVDEFPR